MYKFGSRINEMILKRQIPKGEFAKRLGLTQNQLSLILTNQSLTTVPALKEMALILDTPSDYLLQDTDKMFMIYAIDDYLSMIEKGKAKTIMLDFIEKFLEGDK